MSQYLVTGVYTDDEFAPNEPRYAVLLLDETFWNSTSKQLESIGDISNLLSAEFPLGDCWFVNFPELIAVPQELADAFEIATNDEDAIINIEISEEVLYALEEDMRFELCGLRLYPDGDFCLHGYHKNTSIEFYSQLVNFDWLKSQAGWGN